MSPNVYRALTTTSPPNPGSRVDISMIRYASDYYWRLVVATSSERGQSMGSFMLVVLFAAVACAIGYVLVMSGDIIGGGEGAGPHIDQPNFEPPNPLD